MKRTILFLLITIFASTGLLFAADEEGLSLPAMPGNLIYEFDQATCEAMKFIALPTGQTRNVPVLMSEGFGEADAISCKTKYPLMTERLASYGSILTTKDRSGITKRQFDKSDEKLLTAAGRELHKDLMIFTVGKLFAIFQAPVSYNGVLIIPYEQVPRDDSLLEPIRAAFEKAAKLDAASD